MKPESNRYLLLSGMLGRITTAFMQFSILRVALIGVFMAAFTYAADIATKNYLSELEVPPSYRHMDTLYFNKIMDDVLDAKKAGPQTLLVMGDCVAFGHGVKQPFTSFMDVPDREVINISMQSFWFEQMIRTLGEAKARGVDDVLIQLHPYANYVTDETNWQILTKTKPVTAGISITDEQFNIVAQSRVNTKTLTTRQEIKGKLGLLLTWSEWFDFSSKIRFDVMQNFPLFRNRHILDDMLLKQSYFSERSTRINSFSGVITDEWQVEILKNQTALWKNFKVDNEEEYLEKLVPNSGAARLARAAKDLDMNATFVLVPTFVDKMIENTVLERSDFDVMVEMLEKSVTQYDAKFINLLEDPILETKMYHYDNLTDEGHQLLGEKLSALLSGQASVPTITEELPQ